MLLLATAVALVSALTQRQQLYCMYEFYEATGGDNWSIRDGWPTLADQNEDEDYCMFFGVKCDSSGDIYGISLPGNRLQGKVPICLMNLGLQEFNINGNRVGFTIPDLGLGLRKLEVAGTDVIVIMMDFERMTDIEVFNLRGQDMSLMFMPSNLIFSKTATHIDLSDTKRPFDFFEVSLTTIVPPKFSLAGLDLSGTKFRDIPLNYHQELDLTGTWLSSGYSSLSDLLSVVNLTDVQFQHTDLNNVVDFTTLPDLTDYKSKSIVLRNTGLRGNATADQILNFITKKTNSDFFYLDLSRNSFIGAAPTISAVRSYKAKKTSFKHLRMEDNSFFCNVEDHALYGCELVRVTETKIINNRLYVTATFSGNPYHLNLEHSLSLAFRNMKKYNDKTLSPTKRVEVHETYNFIHVRQLSGSSKSSVYRIDVTLDPDVISAMDLSSLTPNEVAVLYEGRSISTGMVNVLREYEAKKKGKIFERRDTLAELLGKPVAVREISEHERLEMPASAIRKDDAAIKEVANTFTRRNMTWTKLGSEEKNKLPIDIHAMSRCPDFYFAVENYIIPFLRDYPDFLDFVSLKYVGLAERHSRYPIGGRSKHGLQEVEGDKQLMCLQEHVDTLSFYRVVSCVLGKGREHALPTYMEVCLEEVLANDKIVNSILRCSQDDFGLALMQQANEISKRRGSISSPDIFVADKLEYSGTGEWQQFDSVKGFAERICQAYQREMHSLPEACNEVVGKV
ncbi:Leucine-rich repeat protein 1 virus receptor protein [Giardia muris]|uniref:Leucine-rich repeat protein 1 virus receptor protein n=1 Tax=Giardia muris TaxID=5742 RepID=A0A4Z1T2F1_GIAMU|nr:Leucine-rich repeat protein 1 virus receptor protein [Giardia muris]|eukprot:TNJ28113.1 Leucine-rich repeat protein 1 virus receptor protein [Giardia muris]